MSSSLVKMFNSTAEKVTGFAKNPAIEPILNGLTSVNQRIELKVFKDFFVKPFMLADTVQKFFWGNRDVQKIPVGVFGKITADASLVKIWLCALNFLLQLPRTFSALKPIEGAGDRLGFKKDDKVGLVLKGKKRDLQMLEGPVLSKKATVFKRLSSVALLVIGFVESIGFVKNYIPIPNSLNKTAAGLSTIAVTYMGAQCFYQELQFRQNEEFKDYHSSEKHLNTANLVMNFSYLFFGTVGLVGLCLGEKGKEAYPLFSKFQFGSSCAVYLTPLIQYGFEQYRNSFIPPKSKKD